LYGSFFCRMVPFLFPFLVPSHGVYEIATFLLWAFPKLLYVPFSLQGGGKTLSLKAGSFFFLLTPFFFGAHAPGNHLLFFRSRLFFVGRKGTPLFRGFFFALALFSTGSLPLSLTLSLPPSRTAFGPLEATFFLPRPRVFFFPKTLLSKFGCLAGKAPPSPRFR